MSRRPLDREHPGPASLAGRRAQRWDVGSQGDSTGVNAAVLGHNRKKERDTSLYALRKDPAGQGAGSLCPGPAGLPA